MNKLHIAARTLLESKLNGALTVEQLAKTLRAQRKLTESAVTSAEPLEKQFIQFIKQGNRYSPAGEVVLVDSLKPSPYKICMTMNGPVFERVLAPTDEVMVFENSPMNAVVQEIDRFWDRKAAYDKLGLMHNRGILLYGPPGTGKSIALQQVTEMMAKRGDVVFFVDSPEAIREGMGAFRQIEPNRRVVICFEEAEEMCRYNERTMLRIMDGDAKISGALFLATTNYINQLPPRMLRPGRFDKKVYVGFPLSEHRRQYLTHKLKGIEEDAAKIEEMVQRTKGLGFGHLRELIAGVYAIGDSMDTVLKSFRDKPIMDDQIPEDSVYASDNKPSSPLVDAFSDVGDVGS